MVDFREHYKEELNNSNTNYFILDAAGQGRHGNIDFFVYCWDRDKFDGVSENDLFIYMRKKKDYEISGKFYFFGAGKIERIESVGSVRVKGIITKVVVFKDKLSKDDLKDFQWKFERRGVTGEDFFNQYGMNSISREEFINLLIVEQSKR